MQALFWLVSEGQDSASSDQAATAQGNDREARSFAGIESDLAGKGDGLAHAALLPPKLLTKC